MMKKFVAILLAALLLCSAAACSAGTDAPADGQTNDGGAAPKKDGIVVVTQVSPDSLDPQGTTMQYAHQVLANFNDTLMEYDASNNLVASLVESYTVNDDSTVFTFKLKEGVLFHNGEELKASDVVYTVNRGKNHPFSPANYPMIESCTALSDYEVEFKLTSSYSPFLGVLATAGFSILNEKATEEAGDGFARNPVGCGPYQFVSWAEGENIVMKAFDGYHGGAPEIKNVTVKFIGDANTALIGLEAGDVDYTYVYPESAKPDIKENPDLDLFYYDSTALQFFTLNTANEKLSNKLVRQAINYAVNREDIITVAMEGEGVATSQFCNTNTFGYLEGLQGYTRDVEKAKALMAEAGYGDGFSITITAQDAMTNKMAEVLMSNLAEIGITCTIETLESNTAVANFMAGEYEIGVLGINNAQMDFDFMKVLFQPDGSLNLCKYNDAALFQMFADASAVSDTEQRLAIYTSLYEDYLMDLALYVPVFYPNRAHAMSSALTVDYVGGSGIVLFKNIGWK